MIFFTDLPTLFSSDRYRKQTISFLGFKGVHSKFKVVALSTLEHKVKCDREFTARKNRSIVILRWVRIQLFLIPAGALRDRGGRTRVTYFAEEGVFFKTSACPRFRKRRVLVCTQIRRMGVENPLTKYTRL